MNKTLSTTTNRAGLSRSLSAGLLAAMLLLSGCAGIGNVSSDVSSFGEWPAGRQPGSYAFERLPSQQAVGVQQDPIEGLARNALARVGMELNPAAARYSVQVRVNTQVIEQAAYGSGYDGFGFATPGVFLGGGNRGLGFGLSFPIGYSDAYYRRELTLLVRDLTSSQVVFETRAVNDGRQNETLAALSSMMDAALQGFPQPPAGPRRIAVPVQ